MSSIETVLGPVNAAELGFTLPHEHIWCDQRLAPRGHLFGANRNPSSMMRLDDEPALIEELAAFKAAGGGAVLADHITREIEVGVGSSERRCKVVKSAIHRVRVEGVELKVLRAVAKAQRRTGVAITTHATGGRRQEVPGGNAGYLHLFESFFPRLRALGVSAETLQLLSVANPARVLTPGGG
jgi:predicted metal-dependent phosphotriesterase family hydrolase